MSSTPLLRTERKRSLLLPTLAGGALVAIGALSSQRHSSSRSPPELYNKKETYGKSYGQLAGDDAVQKSWPGATCARSDDDQKAARSRCWHVRLTVCPGERGA